MPVNVSNQSKFVPESRFMDFETKEAVSVSLMAKMVGLSRASFYQLLGSAFPWPIYCVHTRRPYFTEELQRISLEVRRRNCGIDGKPILFYARHAPKAIPKKRPANVQNPNVELLEGLRGLGLVVNSPQVAAAIKTIYPRGVHGVDPGEVIRSVFIHLKSKVS